MEKKMIEVVFLGYQKRFKGTEVFLVKEVKSHWTVVYDKKRHVLVDEQKKGSD